MLRRKYSAWGDARCARAAAPLAREVLVLVKRCRVGTLVGQFEWNTAVLFLNNYNYRTHPIPQRIGLDFHLYLDCSFVDLHGRGTHPFSRCDFWGSRFDPRLGQCSKLTVITLTSMWLLLQLVLNTKNILNIKSIVFHLYYSKGKKE